MNKNSINILLTVLTIALLVAGVICLAISIFGETEKTVFISVALGCICIANLINVFRRAFSKR